MLPSHEVRCPLCDAYMYEAVNPPEYPPRCRDCRRGQVLLAEALVENLKPILETLQAVRDQLHSQATSMQTLSNLLYLKSKERKNE